MEKMQKNKNELDSDKKAKKANLLNHNSIKHILDESASGVVKSNGFPEDVRMSNIQLLIGTTIIVVALFAQFYNKKFPENRNFLIACLVLYIFFIGILKLLVYAVEKNAILFTHPPAGSFSSTGLVVTSKLPRLSDRYTLTIGSADPKSISAKPQVELTKSVTQWFTKDGVLVEGLFWKDVEGLLNDYAKETNKSK